MRKEVCRLCSQPASRPSGDPWCARLNQHVLLSAVRLGSTAVPCAFAARLLIGTRPCSHITSENTCVILTLPQLSPATFCLTRQNATLSKVKPLSPPGTVRSRVDGMLPISAGNPFGPSNPFANAALALFGEEDDDDAEEVEEEDGIGDYHAMVRQLKVSGGCFLE